MTMSINTFLIGTTCILITLVAFGIIAESYIEKKFKKH